jgi:GTP-binding protein EngB required for normal cell division
MFGQGLFKRKQLLSERQSGLLGELRSHLEQLLATIERFGADADPADMQTLRDILANLDELFLIVIAGEFNSGKSSFLNALLGAPVLPEGVTPTTDAITLLRYGDEAQSEIKTPGLREHVYPADVLRQLVIVDTPGTNAIVREHERLTKNFVPRADLVLFTTSADRPFTESERAFLTLIKEWGKKIVFILNKIDILNPEELEQVLGFVGENARDLMGSAPDIFPVSARQAIRARSIEDPVQAAELRATSRFDAIEKFVVETLDEETRVRLKLLSPLGVAQKMASTYLGAVNTRLDTLKDDFATLDNIEQQLGLFKEDLANDVQYHIGELDIILRDFEERGQRFFDEHIRIGNLPTLLNSDKMKQEFQEEVVGDLAGQIDKRVATLIDWMVEKDLRLWQSTVDYINRRRATPHADKLIGQIGGSFDYNRGALIDTIGQTATKVVATYDKKAEAEQLVEEVRGSIAATAITEAGAVGLGALLVTLFSTALLDFTGILAATLVALGGFTLLPAKRRQAKQLLREKVDAMRNDLRESIERQFGREVDGSLSRVRDAISPYTRFVRAQRTQFSELQSGLSEIDNHLKRLRTEIE